MLLHLAGEAIDALGRKASPRPRGHDRVVWSGAVALGSHPDAVGDRLAAGVICEDRIANVSDRPGHAKATARITWVTIGVGRRDCDHRAIFGSNAVHPHAAPRLLQE